MKQQWGEVLRDHGFNPPPLWPLLGGALANRVPPGSHAGILALTLLDPLLLLAMFAAIAWAFGVESMLLASIYFCTIHGASFGWIGGGFLRYVWLASLVGAVCCLKRDRTPRRAPCSDWRRCCGSSPPGSPFRSRCTR